MALINNASYDATIVAYGSGVAKNSGKAYFFIDFAVENEVLRWMGSPIKNDGQINAGFPTQLAAAGFDAERHTVADLSLGYGSDVLNDMGTTKIRVAQKINGSGEKEWAVAWVGESKTATVDEVKAAMPKDIDDKLKAAFPRPTRKFSADNVPF
jgi:hypothetical protein